MKVVDNRATTNNNKTKKQTLFDDQNSISIIKKNLNEINLASKPKPKNLTHTSLEEKWDLSLMRLVNRSTKNKEIQVSVNENN